MEFIFKYLNLLDSFFWNYGAFLAIISLGFLLTFKSGFFQILRFSQIGKTFFAYLRAPEGEGRGVHPIKTFFASVGGMIGIGNIVGIVTAVQLGGPGALFWVWVTGVVGAMIKYGEVYLGLKYRVANNRGGYDGGPLFFLKKAFRGNLTPILVATLLCIYGVEIYQFSVITDSVSANWHIGKPYIIAVLLGLVLVVGWGGVRRTAEISSWIMPLFMLCYLGMGGWILLHEYANLPGLFLTVLSSAFTGHAAVGGFVGSGVLMTIQHGMSRAAYSADIGVGYDSIIQSESSAVHPEKQARLAILGVFIDNFICTLSMILVLISGVWKSEPHIEGSQLVQTALSTYFPYMSFFMPIFLITCGYTTIIAYFCVGLKCARFLAPKRGPLLYTLYAAVSFVIFSFSDQTRALTIMSISGALLLIINLLAIYRLRNEIRFTSDQELESIN